MVSFRPTIGETCQALWEPLAFLSLLICSRRSSVSKTDGLFPLRLSRRESLSPQAVGVLPKTQNQAKKTQQRSPLLPLAVVSAVRLAGSLGDRQARYLPSLAARSLQMVLAVEVASRQAAIAREHSPAYCRHGEGKSQLGSGPNSCRAIRAAGDLCLTTNRTCLLRSPAAKVQGEHRLSIGGPLFTITLRRSSPATFWSRSRLASKSCTCCWSL